MKVFNVTWLKQSKDQQDYRKKEKKREKTSKKPIYHEKPAHPTKERTLAKV